jgi:hypothetical protein
VNKFHARAVHADGYRFASGAEYLRYCELLLLERAGAISELRVQPRYQILPREGTERARHYTPDFEYVEDGRQVAEDVKGGNATLTDAARLRMSLFRRRYPGIELRIIKT